MECYKDLPIYYVAAHATRSWLFSASTVAGVAIVQSDIQSIRVDIYERLGSTKRAIDTDGAYKTDGSGYALPTASSTIFDTWQHGDSWDIDSVGYNGKYIIAFPKADRTYYARITIALINLDVIVVDALFVTR